MHVRSLRPSDIPILKEYADTSGFPYPELDHPHIESVMVVVDSEDRPIMACAAKRLVELYLYVSRETSPPVKMAALKSLHVAMADSLRAKMYNDCEIYLPPQIADAFGRRLERTWNWVRNWPSWTIRF